MKARRIKSDFFDNYESAPVITRWLTHGDLILPTLSNADAESGICGVEYAYQDAWVIFYSWLGIQIINRDSHSLWFLDNNTDELVNNGIFDVNDSEWKQTFALKEIENKNHYIICFSRYIIEVICEDLIFGKGEFDAHTLAENDHRFACEYIVRAHKYLDCDSLEKAKRDLERYLFLYPNGKDVDYVRKWIKYIELEEQENRGK